MTVSLKYTDSEIRKDIATLVEEQRIIAGKCGLDTSNYGMWAYITSSWSLNKLEEAILKEYLGLEGG